MQYIVLRKLKDRAQGFISDVRWILMVLTIPPLVTWVLGWALEIEDESSPHCDGGYSPV